LFVLTVLFEHLALNHTIVQRRH